MQTTARAQSETSGNYTIIVISWPKIIEIQNKEKFKKLISVLKILNKTQICAKSAKGTCTERGTSGGESKLRRQTGESGAELQGDTKKMAGTQGDGKSIFDVAICGNGATTAPCPLNEVSRRDGLGDEVSR